MNCIRILYYRNVSEHIGYTSILKHVTENSKSGKKFANLDSESFYDMGISVELESTGVGAPVFLNTLFKITEKGNLMFMFFNVYR